jgi:hypothetical protein
MEYTERKMVYRTGRKRFYRLQEEEDGLEKRERKIVYRRG